MTERWRFHVSQCDHDTCTAIERAGLYIIESAEEDENMQTLLRAVCLAFDKPESDTAGAFCVVIQALRDSLIEDALTEGMAVPVIAHGDPGEDVMPSVEMLRHIANQFHVIADVEEALMGGEDA